MDGIEATRCLKNIVATRNIPVILSTGIRLSPADLKIAFDAGASDFIRKPLEKTEFIARISSHLKMAEYIKTIQRQENEIAEATISRLNEKVESLQMKIDDNKAVLTFFYNTFENVHSKIDAVDCINVDNAKNDLVKISAHIKQAVRSLKSHFSNADKPNDVFVKKLLGVHPNLTPQEIQLCFMLKNKLSTKDISAMTFREESSVKVSRSRLRKKLLLKDSENLVVYLEQF